MLRARLAPMWSGAARAGRGVAALFALCALFELPTLVLTEPVRPTGEILVILTLYAASTQVRVVGPALRWLLGAAALFLIVYCLDRTVFEYFMGDEPLLYDQAFMLRHLFVLAWDLWSWEAVAIVTGAFVAVLVLIGVVGFLLGVARRAFEPVRLAAVLVALVVVWGAAFSVSLAEPDAAFPRIRWLRPEIVANVEESWRIHEAVCRGLQRSPYRAYASLHLARKPDVYLFFVESYGKFALEDATVRPLVAQRLRRMEQHARDAGWSAVSAFSRAPVSGGRSWLAEGSVLMGTEVRYEAVFQHLASRIEEVPNLVGFLAGQGYHSLLLAPADRVRPGIEAVNYYHYERQVRFDDLDYRGPRYGWGIVPDQFSLEHTHRAILSHAHRPLFFDFHMVSSHAPWASVPRLVDDWRTLGDDAAEDATPAEDVAPPEASSEEDGAEVIERRLDRYLEKGRRHRYMGAYTARLGKRYGRAIVYDLALIDRYVPRIAGDALVVVMGDHQPPFVAHGTKSFDVPVHVMARDKRLLDEFRIHGFSSGLWLEPREASVRHEGLFSLLVRVLARAGGVKEGAAPEYRPRGAELVQ